MELFHDVYACVYDGRYTWSYLRPHEVRKTGKLNLTGEIQLSINCQNKSQQLTTGKMVSYISRFGFLFPCRILTKH